MVRKDCCLVAKLTSLAEVPVATETSPADPSDLSADHWRPLRTTYNGRSYVSGNSDAAGNRDRFQHSAAAKAASSASQMALARTRLSGVRWPDGSAEPELRVLIQCAKS